MFYPQFTFTPLFLTNISRKKGAAKIMVPTVPKDALQNWGQFFALIHIEGPQAINNRLLTLFEEIEDIFYSEETLPDEFNALSDNFEKILQGVNTKFEKILKINKVHFNADNVNFIIGFVKEEELHFVQKGDMRAVLLHKIQSAHPGEEEDEPKYKIIDILDSVQEKTDKKGKPQLFSHLISGNIQKADAVFFTNKTVLKYLPLDKVKEVITALPAESAVEHLKNLLAETNDPFTFCSLLIKQKGAVAKKKKLLPRLSDLTPQRSIKKLMDTEEETEKFLSPSFRPEIGKYLKKAGNQLGEKIKALRAAQKEKRKIAVEPLAASEVEPSEVKLGEEPMIEAEKKTKEIEAAEIPALQGQASEESMARTTDSLNVEPEKKSIPEEILEKPPRQPFKLPRIQFKKTVQNLSRAFQEQRAHAVNKTKLKAKGWYKKARSLSSSSQILLVIAMIFALLFALSIFMMSRNKARERRELAYQEQLQKVEEIFSLVQSREIIGDEAKAKIYLGEIPALLTELPQETDVQKQKYKELQEQFQNKEAELKHAADIAAPPIIADLSSLETTAALTKLFKVDHNLFSFGENNLLYQISTKEKKVKEIAVNNLGAPLKNYTLGKDNNAYLLLTDNTAAKFNASDGAISSINLAMSAGNQIGGIFFYGDNLYAADKTARQILKYKASPDGFSSGQNWLKEAADLSQTSSLAVDGNIYVLDNAGKVTRYFKGRKEEFNLSFIDPPFLSATKIYTNSETKYLYILDPANKRLVVYDKEGKLKLQYTSPHFDALKDFVVEENNKVIYLLNEKRVYRLVMEHLD